MDERSSSGEMEKGDEVILPGFRFHPTDEELVSFYLKRKVQQKPLSIELIRQLDIYKYDPWDLPKLTTTGEKEWYFYCPRDRKYRNSTRPNRVTGAGFWKATGTDRPIYSSEGSRCIGLKKSLVFYKGRAAKGIKTDWMMHEFRLPSLPDHSSLLKRPIDHKNIPASDSWAICRIFKKTNSVAHRALSHSWVSSPAADHLNQPNHNHHQHHLFSLPPPPPNNLHFGPPSVSEIISSMTTDAGLQQQQNSAAISYPPLDFISYKPAPPTFTFSSAVDVTSMLLNLSAPPPPPPIPNMDLGVHVQQRQQQQQCNAFAVDDLPLEEKLVSAYGPINGGSHPWGSARKSSSAVDLPAAAAAAFGVQMASIFSEEWKASNNPSEISASFSTNKC